jgi:hypothetical protein
MPRWVSRATPAIAVDHLTQPSGEYCLPKSPGFSSRSQIKVEAHIPRDIGKFWHCGRGILPNCRIHCVRAGCGCGSGYLYSLRWHCPGSEIVTTWWYSLIVILIKLHQYQPPAPYLDVGGGSGSADPSARGSDPP